MTVDLELWRVRKVDRVMRAVVRTIRPVTASWDDTVGLELRVEHNGEIYLTELRRDQAALEARSAELLKSLEAHGWTACGDLGSGGVQ